MTYAALGLVAAIAFVQGVPEDQPGRSTSNSSKVWKTVEFVPASMKTLELPGIRKLFSFDPSKPKEQIELKYCSKMPMVTVHPSVDSKIVVPRSVPAPKPHVRMLGREMPACRNR